MNVYTKVITSLSLPLKRCCHTGIRNAAASQIVEVPTKSDHSRRGNLPDIIHDQFKIAVDDGEYGLVQVDRRPKFAFHLNGAVRRGLEHGEYRIGLHPGTMRIVTLSMPINLQDAYSVLLDGYHKKDLRREAQKLYHFIKNREPPLEKHVRDQKVAEMMAKIINSERVDPEHPNVIESDRNELLNIRDQRLKKQIRQHIYNHAPIDFSKHYNCMAYMMARLPADYAALVKAMSQLKAQLPDFAPSSMMDFGSGVGSATWAVDKVWPKQCQEVVNVDNSSEMNLLNEKLQRGGTLEGPYQQRSKRTFFRNYLPISATIKHNLVVMSRTLLELNSADARLRILDILWKTVTPGGCLLLVEDGRYQSFDLMLEAREFLRVGIEATGSGRRGIIVAPCPHQHSCPLLLKEKRYRKCTDSIMHLTLDKDTSTVPEETFSYLAVYKPKARDLVEGFKIANCNAWPRIVQPVKTSSHSIVRVCNKYGDLQELSVTNAKNGNLCRQVARRHKLGDLFPVELLPVDKHYQQEGKLYGMLKHHRRAMLPAPSNATTTEDDNENQG
uniref:Methyltransferase-like protein 17, mitochondrial n=1 Tax=Hirondellea gigas TaxID=1518452 RepID=A0A2P2I1U1_9CRUS